MLQMQAENLYKGTMVHLLMPTIQDAIDNYYKDYLKTLPIEAFYSVEVLELKSIKNNCYLVKVQVKPYLGPHNTVGVDEITIIVAPSGEVRIEKFVHLKSYGIAPNYSNEIINWPPKEGEYQE